MSELSFEVPSHPLMLARVPGKVPNTVLTVEQQVFTVRICEYGEPLSYGRFWCFTDVSAAMFGLAIFLGNPEVDEPSGWTRAVDFVDGYRLRKVRDGKIVVVEPEF